MKRRRDSVKAGIFALLALLAIALLLVLMLGRSLFADQREYVTVFPRTVAGLEKGAPVKYLGVPAGSVSDIRFEENHFPNVRVTMQIAKHIPVTWGTRATLNAQPLTGIAHIELIGGDNGDAPLSEGGRIPSEASNFERLSSALPLVAERLPALLERWERATIDVQEILAGVDRERLAGIADEFEATLAAARGAIEAASMVLDGDLKALASTIGVEVERTSAVAREAIAAVQTDVHDTLARTQEVALGPELEATLAQLRVFSEELVLSWERVDSLLVRLDRSVDAQTLADLRAALHETSGLLGELRRDPGLLLFSTPARERRIPDSAPRAETRR